MSECVCVCVWGGGGGGGGVSRIVEVSINSHEQTQ